MGLRIMESTDGRAVLYCSTTDWAFGPIFNDPDEAERFLDWFDDEAEAEVPQDELLKGRKSVRGLTDATLERLVSEFRGGEGWFGPYGQEGREA